MKTEAAKNRTSDFYTPSGLHVYFKDKIENDVDVEKVVQRLEDTIPHHLKTEVEMIIIGQFEEFKQNDFNAFYDSGTVCVTNEQSSEDDMFDDLIHEYAHSIEEPYGYEIYGDSKIKNEFLAKRNMLHDILWKSGFKAPKSLFTNTEYDKTFDEFLYKQVGYEKLKRLCVGIFISAYAPTSLREYFATGFTEFFMYPDAHIYLQKTSPELYKKLFKLYSEETLDR